MAGICQCCGKPFMRDRNGREIFVEITDPIGNVVKRHKVCAEDNEVAITAQPGDIGENIGGGYYHPRQIGEER